MKKVLCLLVAIVFILQSYIIAGAKEVEIEAGSSMDNATEIELNTTYVGNANVEDRWYWYKFTTEEEAYYIIDFKSFTDKSQDIVLYSKYKEKIDDRVRTGDWLERTDISSYLSSNETYYIAIEADFDSELGHHQINVSYKTDDEGDEYQTANYIGLNQKLYGEIDHIDDVDFFCFEGDSTKEYQCTLVNMSSKSLNGENDSGKSVTIYNSNTKELDEVRTKELGKQISVDLKGESKYYIMVDFHSSWLIDDSEPQEYSLIITEPDDSQINEPEEESTRGSVAVIGPAEKYDEYYNDKYYNESECDHRNQSNFSTGERIYEQYDDSMHKFYVAYDTKCLDCEDVLVANAGYSEYLEGHDIIGSICTICGYSPEYTENNIFSYYYYKDMENGGYGVNEVSLLSNLGIVDGWDGYFNPNNTLTRAEAAKLLFVMLREDDVEQCDTMFEDVPDDHWASGIIKRMTDIGIIHGYGNGYYGPEDYLTGYQLLTLVVNALGYEDEAIRRGGFPYGHYDVAKELQLTDMLAHIDFSGRISRVNAAIVIYNAVMNTSIKALWL